MVIIYSDLLQNSGQEPFPVYCVKLLPPIQDVSYDY